jgi:hypothetical protein
MDSANYVDPYLQAYRDSLQEQYDAAVANIEQQRTNDMANIMAQANTRGMMYSNFPERSKYQYDTGTYSPSIIKARQSYQTGLDTLREKGVQLANQIKTVEEKIADLNSMYND